MRRGDAHGQPRAAFPRYSNFFPRKEDIRMQTELIPEGKFPLGQIVATPGAIEALRRAGQTPLEFLARHARGDWGELDREDQQENGFSLREGFRLLSAYRLKDGRRLWIITEADRSVTTFLLPEEY